MDKTYIDFIQDEKFIEWILFDSKEAEAYWKNIALKQPEWEAPMHEAALFLKNYRLNDVKMDPRLKAQLREKIIRSARKKRIRRRATVWSAVAASLAILIVSMVYIFPGNEDPESEMIVGRVLSDQDIILIMDDEPRSFTRNLEIEIDTKGLAVIKSEEGGVSILPEKTGATMNKLVVPYGKRSSLKLSDGTVLWLNSGSEIMFPSVFANDNRTINLVKGEMYIEVSTDKRRPFFVQTTDFNIRVYGTRFNVSLYEDYQPSVILAQGEISVITRDLQETAVYPNQRAIYTNNGEVIKERVRADHYTTWKDGYINLYETPLTDILPYVERYYNISFEYGKNQEFESITCTGKLYLSESIDDMMNSLATLSSTTYEFKDGKIYFIN